MEISKYIFVIVASITLFGVFGGFTPNISIVEIAFKALAVGLVFVSVIGLKQATETVLHKIA